MLCWLLQFHFFFKLECFLCCRKLSTICFFFFSRVHSICDISLKNKKKWKNKQTHTSPQSCNEESTWNEKHREREREERDIYGFSNENSCVLPRHRSAHSKSKRIESSLNEKPYHYFYTQQSYCFFFFCLFVRQCIFPHQFLSLHLFAPNFRLSMYTYIHDIIDKITYAVVIQWKELNIHESRCSLSKVFF